MSTSVRSSSSSASSSKPQIVFFKTPTSPDNIEQDPYHSIFSTRGYEATFIPVLEEVFSTDELEGILSERSGLQGSEKENALEGIIITSRRGAEGWIRAVTSSTDPDGIQGGQGQGTNHTGRMSESFLDVQE